METTYKMLFLLFGLGVLTHNAAAADYKPERYVYEIESAGTGANETVLYRIRCEAKSPNMAEEAASASAVHGIIFQGCRATDGRPEQTPLCKDETLTQTQTAYFDRFFANRSYKQYISAVAKSSMKITKTKTSYRIEVVVSINKRKLRLDLENEGIIRKLDSAFAHN